MCLERVINIHRLPVTQSTRTPSHPRTIPFSLSLSLFSVAALSTFYGCIDRWLWKISIPLADAIPSTIEPRIAGVAALGLARAESRFVRFHGQLPGNLPVRYLSKKEKKNYPGVHFVPPALLHFLCNGGFLRTGTSVREYLEILPASEWSIRILFSSKTRCHIDGKDVANCSEIVKILFVYYLFTWSLFISRVSLNLKIILSLTYSFL